MEKTAHAARMLALTFTMMVSMPLFAQTVYKVVDENGKVTYTDSPGNDKQAETVEVPKTNTQPAIKPTTQTHAKKTPPKSNTNYHVAISSPAPETHLMPGEWHLTVNISVTPQLQENHYLLLTDNGSPVGEPQQNGTFNINYIAPGSHTFTASVVTNTGRNLSTGEPITVYVHRAKAK